MLPDGYVSQTLVQQLNTNQTFSDAVHALGTHSCSAAPTWKGDSTSFSQKWWCTELEVHNGWSGGASWAEYLSTNFVKSNQTSTTSWSLIWSTPAALSPYQNCGSMYASEPWSGHYTVDAAIWMHAHWTQFTEIGWRILTVESKGSGFLPDGSGTFVSMVSPDGRDFSIVMERLANASSMQYQLYFKNLEVSKPLSLWKTSESSYFQLDETQGHGGVITPTDDGVVTVDIAGHSIYTLSTVTTASHGNFSDSPVPPSGNFSLPYADDFSVNYTQHEVLPRFFADQGGSFAVIEGTLMQTAPMPPGKNGWVSTFDYRDDPITMIGDLSWTNVSLKVRSKFEEASDQSDLVSAPQYVQICGRVSVYQSYAKGNYLNSGVCLRLNASSLAWQLLERTQINSQEGYKVLRGGTSANQSSWHELGLDLVGSRAFVGIDGARVASGISVQATHGMAMLGSSYNLVQFDDFAVWEAHSSGSDISATCTNNTDLPGANLDATPHSNMSACAASCQANHACVAWVFGSCGGYAMCYQKRTVGAAVAKACVCSAVIPGRHSLPPSPPPPAPPTPTPPAPPIRPLAPVAYRALKLGSIQPAGWMALQLGSQRSGLSGHQQIGGGVHAAAAAWINGSGYDGFHEAWVYWL